MTKKKEKKILKGNMLWSIGYALTSIKTHKVRNMGIVLVLAISVAIPTTVFAWTNTGARLAVEQYFDENAYQFSIQNDEGAVGHSNLIAAQNLVLSSPFAEYAHITPTTVGILRMDNITPEWDRYRIDEPNYEYGIKDCRVIVVNNDILKVWSNELQITGNSTLRSGEIMVSQRFIDYAEEVLNGPLNASVDLGIGSEIGMDILRTYYYPQEGRPFDPLLLNRLIVRNLTIVGIYDITRLSVIIESFLDMTRGNYVIGTTSSVLGITDSILILDEDIGAESVQTITEEGFFSPVEFIRGSIDGLVQGGVTAAAQNLLNLKTQIEESDVNLNVHGFENIDGLQTHIETYQASQVLIILAIPIMIMSLMLTIFTSETSVVQRKGEISALRAKGASFNQIFSAVIGESVILSILGSLAGIGFSVLAAPLMGSSTGLLTFDPVLYNEFLAKMIIPFEALTLAATIAFFLPAAYLLHVARRIDVAEIGQPTMRLTYEIPEEVNIWYFVLGLAGVLSVLLIVPVLFNPVGQIAFIEILIATSILFIASYLGSRAMRLVTARASESMHWLLGEKKLYLTQSLRRRKGQFIPLLVILTLTLTTTTMMLIQTASFEDTIENEALYALGCDVRIELPDHALNWTDTIEGYDGVVGATPLIETLSYIGSDAFYLEGLDIGAYSEMGPFKPSSFVGSSPEEILAELSTTENGIIISMYHMDLWNVTIGDTLSIRVIDNIESDFEIVGFMRSAPGFGLASNLDIRGVSFGAHFDFQPGRGGFALVNIDHLSTVTGFNTSEVFFVETTSIADASELIEDVSAIPYSTVFNKDNIEFGSDTTAGLFLAGLEGLTMISFIMCASMAIASIALFLGSAVAEREPEYALFRAIGGTKKQVVSLVFGEFAGSVLAAVLTSFGLGILFGYTMTLLTFGISSVWPILPKVLTFPLFVMILTVTLELVAMIVACYFPARRAGNTNPAEVLRNM
ncbi:MAG: FtsX-like permease family protein [Candidatus Thorarchaeota archaeon]